MGRALDGNRAIEGPESRELFSFTKAYSFSEREGHAQLQALCPSPRNPVRGGSAEGAGRPEEEREKEGGREGTSGEPGAFRSLGSANFALFSSGPTLTPRELLLLLCD